MGVKTIFGENLKQRRKEKHLSQEQLSEKVNISVKHLSSIERGLNFVSAELLDNLSKSLEIPIHQLFLQKVNTLPSGDSIFDVLVKNIDRTVEKNLIMAIEKIKSEIRQSL